MHRAASRGVRRGARSAGAEKGVIADAVILSLSLPFLSTATAGSKREAHSGTEVTPGFRQRLALRLHSRLQLNRTFPGRANGKLGRPRASITSSDRSLTSLRRELKPPRHSTWRRLATQQAPYQQNRPRHPSIPGYGEPREMRWLCRACAPADRPRRMRRDTAD